MIEYTLTPGCVPEPMKLYGLRPDWTRLPEELAKNVNKGVYDQYRKPAGGRIRFRTDSTLIKIEIEISDPCCNHALDVLCCGKYRGRVYGQSDDDLSYWGQFSLCDSFDPVDEDGLRDVTVFLPRTVVPEKLTISLNDGAKVAAPKPYAIEKPIVFYGSSITMGAICSSPSFAYTALVAERLGANHINLGFGGSALGEPNVAEYIASLEMTAFIFDYEYNAPNLEHLKATHKPFFDIVRAAQPELPILMISRPNTDSGFVSACRGRQVILDTLNAALDAGDEHVDYVDGFYLFGNENRDRCLTEDRCHPNDFGFRAMADVVTPRLKKLIER